MIMEGQEILPNNSGQKTVSKTTPVKSRSGISGSGSSCKSPSKMVAVLEKAANDGQLFKAWYVHKYFTYKRIEMYPLLLCTVLRYIDT